MSMHNAELGGKIVIVTGAAGGIGAETVRVLTRRGAKVVAAGLRSTHLDELAAALKDEGLPADVHPVDIGDESSVEALIEYTVGKYGRLDAIDNNAASQGQPGDRDITSMPVEVWDEIMRVNARGTMLMCKHGVPALIASGGGSIVNISSGTALAGDMMFSAYAASKGAINTLTRYVATQYGAQGVRCNALALGLIGTPALQAGLPPPLIDVFQSNKLVGRIGTPLDVAEIVAFLASDRSAFITGQVWSVDGGFFAHVPTLTGVAAAMAALQGGAVRDA